MLNICRFKVAPRLVVLLVLVLALVSSSCAPDMTDALCSRLRIVALNSFAVTHGDYTLNSGASVAGGKCEDGVLPIELGPRSALSDPARWLEEFRWDDSGEVVGPNPLPWRLTYILNAATEAGPDDQDGLLDSLPPDAYTQIFVRLAHPLKEEKLRKLWRNPLAVQVAPTRPLVWERPIFCNYRGFDACQFDDHPEPMTAQFRHWVSLLRDDDAPILAQFDLELAELREYAAAGFVYGFITQDRADAFQTIAKDPVVRTIHIIDVDLSRS